MKYIAHKRFKDIAICGDVNLPAMTECESDGTYITHNGNYICFVGSENAHQYFAINEDGCGMERGKLTQTIQRRLNKRDDKYQDRWDLVWEDPTCQKYKRTEYADYWLWNHSWFQAPIEDLRYIAKLVGAQI